MLEYYVAAVVAVASGAMAENPPPVREFADWFVEFMQAMHEAAVGPNGPWVAQLRDHLWVEPGGLPVRTKTFRMADRPNLQLGLMPVLPVQRPGRTAATRRRWRRGHR